MTPACSDRLVHKKYFQCTTSDPTVYIYTSRVDDGVCDCADGSDETLWSSRCNDAAQIKRMYSAYL